MSQKEHRGPPSLTNSRNCESAGFRTSVRGVSGALMKNPRWLARVTIKVSCPLPTLPRNGQFETEKPYQSNGYDVLPKIEPKRGLKI
jgi:hypothetical protein